MNSLTKHWPHLAAHGLQPGTRQRERLFWVLQISGWSVASVMAMFPLMQIFGLRTSAIILVLRFIAGIGVTCGLRWVYQRVPWREWPWWRLGLSAVTLCFALGSLDSLLTHRIAAEIAAELAPIQVRTFLMVMGMLLRSSVFVIWSLLYFGIELWLEAADARLRASESEAEARTSELRQLRAQVNPHFLFNALNSVLAEKDNPAAVERITQELAEYLRFSLRPLGDFQTLGEELDALEHYLRVEKARFEEKLIYKIEASPQARGVRVPVATVQPLLENAMKYGRRTSAGPLHLEVKAAIDDEAGVVRVGLENTGHWLEFDPERSHGIGLTNLRRRLELLFGVEAQLSHTETNGRVRVQVEIPLGDEKTWRAAP